MRIIILSVNLVWLFISCSQITENDKVEDLSLEEDFMSVTIKDQYSMMIPKYMKEVSNLNQDASLQYQNIYKETYIIVIDEPTDEFISVFKDLEEYNDSISVVRNYRDIQLQYLAEGIDIINMTEPESLQINGLDSEKVTIDGAVEGIDFNITYFLTFIEGSDNLYMIMAWVHEDEKEKYRGTFEQVVGSFKLVNED